ncbi:MAG TPA: ribosome small subunit-dependent GTPase A [Gemmatimonadaceae bacterium]|nr:ribosome small subunit-dependent GTPase A [Gemmatimonadaceae bacterium]
MTERGVVLRGTGGVWHVHTESGATREAALRGRLKQGGEVLKLAVGDEVLVERDERTGAWTIIEILPRRSKLARRAPGGGFGERIVAANVDQVVVVFAAAAPEPHPRMIDRFLVIAAANDLPAHIVINKVDLASEPEVHARFSDYARAGYPLHLTSVKRGLGLDELRAALLPDDGARRVSALSGPSGVGKSSLLNALFPGLDLRVGEISRSVMKGRHTTVGADLHPLAGGAYVMDTPGLREVGVWGLPAEELDRSFLEFRPHLGECRFGDCAHRAEPGCAVRAAVEAGDISAARYESYLKLRAELEENAPDW